MVLYGRSRFSKVGVALGLLFSASLWPCIGRAQSKHPNLILLFEPSSCTAELQPLDLSYNFVFKTGVATLFASWLSQVAQEQLLRGISPDQLTFDLSLKSVQTPFVKWVYMTLNKMSESKKSATADGWRVSGISVSWATTDEDIEERDTLFEARALERQIELFVVKGGRSKDAAVAGLIEQTVVEGSSKRTREEIIEGTSGEDDNGEQWTEIEELDDVEGEENTPADGEESSQLPDELANCFNIAIRTTHCGRTTTLPSKFK